MNEFRAKTVLSCTSDFSRTGQDVQSSETEVFTSLRDSTLLFPTIQDYKAQQVPAKAPKIAGLPQAQGKPEATHQPAAASSLIYSEVQQN